VPKTATDDLIRQLKRSSASSDLLIPHIEQFARRPIEINDKKDREYLQLLIKARSRLRRPGLYSPSMLSNCLRQVYLVKTQEVARRPVDRIEASSYFLNGNFMHFKWQYVLWKMHRRGMLKLVDVPEKASPAPGSEVFVCNSKEDYGGTIDNVVFLPWIQETVAVDWKSMNGNSFMAAISKGPPLRYINQLVGYAMLANELSEWLGLPSKIKRVIIVGENKNGPVMNKRSPSPMGLYEWVFEIEKYRRGVSDRLKKLRYYEREEEQPSVECHSTKILQFKGCPFAYHCRAEVEAVERRERKKKSTEKIQAQIVGKQNGGKKGDRERRSKKRKRVSTANSTRQPKT